MEKRNMALDTYKLFLAVTVMMLHTGYAAKLGYLAVDSFFMINGLLFTRFVKRRNFKWKKEVSKRLKAVWIPYAFIYTLGTFTEILFYQDKLRLIEYFPCLFFLQIFYISGGHPPLFSAFQLWYIPVYLLVFLIFSLLLSIVDPDRLDGVAILLAVVSFLVIIQESESGSWNFSWEWGGIFPIGLLRGFMGFSLGYLLGRICETNFIQKISEKSELLPVLQFASLTINIYIMYLAPVDWIYDVLYLVASFLLLSTIYMRAGIVYHLFTKVSPKIVKLSEPIYYCHCLILAVFINFRGHRPENITELLLYTFIVVPISFLFQKALDLIYQRDGNKLQKLEKEIYK